MNATSVLENITTPALAQQQMAVAIAPKLAAGLSAPRIARDVLPHPTAQDQQGGRHESSSNNPSKMGNSCSHPTASRRSGLPRERVEARVLHHGHSGRYYSAVTGLRKRCHHMQSRRHRRRGVTAGDELPLFSSLHHHRGYNMIMKEILPFGRPFAPPPRPAGLSPRSNQTTPAFLRPGQLGRRNGTDRTPRAPSSS